MIVQAETDAHHTDLITYPHLMEWIDGSINEANWDRTHPCAQEKPPSAHSHTFWGSGIFNSYNENGEQVDKGTYTTKGNLVTISNPDVGQWTFAYHVSGDMLTLDVAIPNDCTSEACREGLNWAFSVAFPGQTWTRVKSGSHVPPGTGSSG